MLGRGCAASEDREGLGLLGVIFVADMIGAWAAAIVVDAIVAVISSRVLLVRPWLYARTTDVEESTTTAKETIAESE